MTRFLGNSHKREVHDLLATKTNCQVNEIKPEHRVPFGSLAGAHAAGYDNCHWCLGGSLR